MLRRIRKNFEQIAFNANVSEPIDYDRQSELSRGRFEIREVFVYDDLYEIDKSKWSSVVETIKVKRTVYRKKQDKVPTIEIAYFVSSKKLKAKEYNCGIRSHWSIENSLHYVKDVTFKEDGSLIRTGNAPANLSVIRSLAISRLKILGCESFAQAIRLVGGKIREIGRLIE